MVCEVTIINGDAGAFHPLAWALRLDYVWFPEVYHSCHFKSKYSTWSIGYWCGGGGEGGGVDTQTFFLLVQQECKCVLEWSTRIHISKSDTWRRLVLPRPSMFSWCKYRYLSFEFITAHGLKLFSLYLFKHSRFEINVINAPVIFRQQKAADWEHATPGTDQGRSWNWKVNYERIPR
jgi:hypothetical protein